MRNAGLEETQVGIKIAGRNINNLRHADDTFLMAERGRKQRGTRDQIANTCCITQNAREFQKNIYFCFINYTKAFECVDHSKLWKILKGMGIPDHLT